MTDAEWEFLVMQTRRALIMIVKALEKIATHNGWLKEK